MRAAVDAAELPGHGVPRDEAEPGRHGRHVRATEAGLPGPGVRITPPGALTIPYLPSPHYTLPPQSTPYPSSPVLTIT